MRVLALVAAAVLAVLASTPRPADACSLYGMREHQLDPAHMGDTVAPSAVTATAEVRREADDTGCISLNTCGDLAWIEVTIMNASDDATHPSELGYQLRIVGGGVPAGLSVPTAAVMPNTSGQFQLYFEYDDHDGFTFMLELRARDLNGNLGPPTVITISEPDESGCAASQPSTLGGALLALLTVLARPRRRHKR